MTLSDAGNYGTLVALVLNFFALLYTAYQIKQNRKALVIGNKSLELSTRTMQIEMLPNIHWVFSVQVKLDRWIKDLNEVVAKCKQAEKNQDIQPLIQLSKNGLESPKGLVSSNLYENAPKWLSTILITGAQYYYDAKAAQVYLCGSENSPQFNYIPALIERCNDSLGGLRTLLSYIDDVIPAVLLKSPASITDEEFLDK